MTCICKRKLSLLRKILLDNLLIVLISLAVIIGVGLGFGLRKSWSHEELRKIWYLGYPGRLLLNMLKMMVLPLVVSSLVTGMASIGNKASGKLGAAALVYYLTTTFAAAVLGIFLVLTIRPGERSESSKLNRNGKVLKSNPVDAMLDLIGQCFPENLIQACSVRKITVIGKEKFERFNETTNETYTVTVDSPHLVSEEGMNVLGIVVFSIILGVVINRLGREGVPLKNVFSSLNSAVMVIIQLFLWYAPFGLVFLVASKFVMAKDVGREWEGLGLYMLTVFTGLTVHSLIVLPLILFAFTRRNPLTFAFNMSKAFVTVWGTASSSVTLPVTMECLVKKNKIDVNIVRFITPIGATVNMDGTALYEAVASIFIAQVNGFDLSVVDVIIISLTSTAAAVGAAGIPQAGLVTMTMVLTAVGLKTEDISMILAVDWFVDRFRGVVNVWGDSIGAGILHHFFKDSLSSTETEFDTYKLEEAKNNTVSQAQGNEENRLLGPSSLSGAGVKDWENSYM